ncbi:hypothetical protein B0H65DRAFT_28663 [Neurospora tetraspora]|uniref:Uncharacterized protein n=1 Tax=Neurospora tetraspora TaxID=94610 RepID=A0AAE0JPC5_9PEZI|nr:hypothetical protein B0H65DRAFT_28663 [Neurospora tetraspora]
MTSIKASTTWEGLASSWFFVCWTRIKRGGYPRLSHPLLWNKHCFFFSFAFENINLDSIVRSWRDTAGLSPKNSPEKTQKNHNPPPWVFVARRWHLIQVDTLLQQELANCSTRYNHYIYFSEAVNFKHRGLGHLHLSQPVTQLLDQSVGHRQPPTSTYPQTPLNHRVLFQTRLLLSINQPVKPAGLPEDTYSRQTPHTHCTNFHPVLRSAETQLNPTSHHPTTHQKNMPRGRGSGYDFPKPIGACPPPKPSSGVGTGVSKGGSDDGSDGRDKEKGTGSSGSHGGNGSK